MPATLQGLDRFAPPDPATAKKMLDHIDGHWWNVYVGGPSSKATGWTPDVVRAFADHGIKRFMITYAGQGSRGKLTTGQGVRDATDALERAARFGYEGHFPLCLDVEMAMGSLPGAPAYVRSWCAAVRKAGARPGVYANVRPLQAFAKAKVRADFVWIASWVGNAGTVGPSHRDAHRGPSLEQGLWNRPGQRAWQYAGEARVLGLNVDVNVAHMTCLAPRPGHHDPAQRPARPVTSHAPAPAHHVGTGTAAKPAAKAAAARPRRRGDRGEVVVRMTRRLSLVRSSATKRPYLDGARRHFDAEAVSALRAFQREHELADTGVYDRRTAVALLRVARRARARAAGTAAAGATATGASAAGPAPTVHPSRLVDLVHTFRRLEAETDKAWEAVEAYGVRRRRLLARVEDGGGAAGGAGGPGGAGIETILRGIEHQLELLVRLEREELRLEERRDAAKDGAPPADAVAPAALPAEAAGTPAADGSPAGAGVPAAAGVPAMAGLAPADAAHAAANGAAAENGGAPTPSSSGAGAPADANGPTDTGVAVAVPAAPLAAGPPSSVAAVPVPHAPAPGVPVAAGGATAPAQPSPQTLDGRIDRLDRRLHRARRARIVQLVEVEQRLRPHVSHTPKAPTRPARPEPRPKADEPRTFVVVSPNMEHATVKRFQQLLNARYAGWKMTKRIEVDGAYGEATDRAAHQVAHGMGIDPARYKRGVTPEARILIRHPAKRTAAEHARGVRRRPWLRRLRKRLSAEGAGPAEAIAYGRKHVNLHETPPGSNRGPLIDRWNRAANVQPGPKAYWCGSFVNACLSHAGMPNQPWLCYCPTTVQRAKGGVDGWSWHPKLADGKPGDLVLYTEPKNRNLAAHVELLVEREPFVVLGGNTSPGAGSQSNGGCVALKRRDPNASSLRFMGYARPPWNR